MKEQWQNFNNWIDPKFGIHIFWIIPVFWLLVLFDFISDKVVKLLKNIKKLFQKRDIKDLKKLSGIK